MNTSVSKLSFSKKFLARFKPAFSRITFALLCVAFDALFFEYKRCSIDAMAKKTGVNYESLYYFFSKAKWNHEKINDIRLDIIQAQRTTRASKHSVLAIDDTSAPKPYAKNTDGAKYQYCGVLGREEICNVAVFSAICSSSKKFPVNYASYRTAAEFEYGKLDPKFKDKITLAQELIDDAVKRQLSFEAVVFDSWYSAKRLIKFIDGKNLTLVTEIKINRKIFVKPPGERQARLISADGLVTAIKRFASHKLKPLRFRSADGKKITRLSYTFTAKLNECDVPLKFVVILGNWSKEDDRKVHILVCNRLSWSARKILTTYMKRWGIEQIFRELKDTFCWDQYQTRRMNHIERFWDVVILVWTAVYWTKQNGCLSKIVEDVPDTFEQFKHVLRNLAGYNRDLSLSKSEVERYGATELGIKSTRFNLRAKRTA